MDSKDSFSNWKIYAFFGFFLVLFGLVYFDLLRKTEPTAPTSEALQQEKYR